MNADALLRGYQRLIAQAHQRGIRIYGATLTPASLPPEREAIRTAVNESIRASRAFDGVIDFDRALRDPARPDTLQRRYDSGDHIHPERCGLFRDGGRRSRRPDRVAAGALRGCGQK